MTDDPATEPSPEDADDTESRPPWPRRLLGWARELAVLLLALAVLIPVVGWLRAPDLPEQAPDFTATDLDGGELRLSELRGEVVVLNFWATWCGPCRLEIPSFSAFSDAHPEVRVLGLAVDGSPGELKAASKRFGISYPVLQSSRDTQQTYGATTLPTTVVVGPEGDIWAAHVGIMSRPHLWWATRGFLAGGP